MKPKRLHRTPVFINAKPPATDKFSKPVSGLPRTIQQNIQKNS